MKLQSKLLLVVVPLIVAPLLALGWFGYARLRSTAAEKTLSEMATLLDQLARNVEAVVATAGANAELFSSSAQIQRYVLTSDEEDRYELLQPSLLRGDPGRLRQILSNLIGNAVKFTQKGMVELRVTSGEERDASALFRFEIRDTGIGIARDALDRIFDSFSQADNSTTRKFGGTGLGLTISKQLVGLMDGEIGARSEPGRGSTFWFTAEIEKQPETAETGYTGGTRMVRESEISSVHQVAPAPEPEDWSNVSILLAEDNPVNREVALGMIQVLGCSTDVAADGQEALDALAHKTYDLVLMDCMMPGTDGYEAARRIRERERADAGGRPESHIPIIAVTANAMGGIGISASPPGWTITSVSPSLSINSRPFSAVGSRGNEKSADLPRETRNRCSPPTGHEQPAEIVSHCSAANNGSPINRRALEAIGSLRTESGPDILRLAVEAYLSHSPKTIETLREAVSEADANAIRGAAHSLESSSANLGAERLAALSKEMEQKGRAGTAGGTEQMLAAIEAEYQTVQNALAAELDGGL